jgi:hypothetical protein
MVIWFNDIPFLACNSSLSQSSNSSTDSRSGLPEYSAFFHERPAGASAEGSYHGKVLKDVVGLMVPKKYQQFGNL